VSQVQGRITRDDIEARFRALQGDVTDTVEEQRSRVIQIALGAGLLVLVLAFLAGRRRGRKKTTVVEIRRV